MRIIAETESEAALLRRSVKGLFWLLGAEQRIDLEDEAGRRIDGRELVATLERLGLAG